MPPSVDGTNFTLRRRDLHSNENGTLTGANTASHIIIEISELQVTAAARAVPTTSTSVTLAA